MTCEKRFYNILLISLALYIYICIKNLNFIISLSLSEGNGKSVVRTKIKGERVKG